MILKLKRTPGLYLVGFMGSGKTTVGRILGEELGWRFIDLDDEIEHEQRASISHLFSTRGEEAFRELERDALWRCVHRIQSGHPTVLALGGGTFAREDNIELISDNGVSIWLDVAYEIAHKRACGSLHRPLARDTDRFKSLFVQRRDLYCRADYRIEVNEDNSRAAAAAILKLPLFK